MPAADAGDNGGAEYCEAGRFKALETSDMTRAHSPCNENPTVRLALFVGTEFDFWAGSSCVPFSWSASAITNDASSVFGLPSLAFGPLKCVKIRSANESLGQ